MELTAHLHVDIYVSVPQGVEGLSPLDFLGDVSRPPLPSSSLPCCLSVCCSRWDSSFLGNKVCVDLALIPVVSERHKGSRGHTLFLGVDLFLSQCWLCFHST